MPKETRPENYAPFPDYIPAGQEMNYPGMGRGGACIDYLPESVHCTDGVEPEDDTMYRGVVKRRTQRGDESIVAVE